MILHIPHSSTIIPKAYKDKINVSKEDINMLTDWYTDELFDYERASTLVFPYSRLFCDVERFRDNKREINFKTGQGVVYTKGYNGSSIREEDTAYEEEIKTTFYDNHHKILSKTINMHLGMVGPVVVVDCHSFSEDSNGIETKINGEYPDICIGFNNSNKPKYINELKKYIEGFGYSVGLNFPFKGTMIPEYLEDNDEVTGLMIEINKNLYLTDNFSKKDTFNEVRSNINSILDYINTQKEEWYENIFRIYRRNI